MPLLVLCDFLRKWEFEAAGGFYIEVIYLQNCWEIAVKMRGNTDSLVGIC